MLTTILAYVIAAFGLATILAGGWSFVMLAIQDERDRPFRHYAVAIAMLAGGFAMVGLAQALRLLLLGCVDGFDQDEAESKRDERAVILRRLLASKCDTLEAFELADSLFNACPCLVECFRKEGGHILGVGSIRDCRTYSALARGVAV